MPDLSFHRLMPPSDSVRLKPLGMKLDRLGGDPAAVAEISPQSGKGEEVWGGGNGSGLSQPGASGCYSANLLVTSLRLRV